MKCLGSLGFIFFSVSFGNEDIKCLPQDLSDHEPSVCKANQSSSLQLMLAVC